MYAFGILGDGERKSAEPIAARACADPELARATHEKLLHFLGRSEWDDRAVRHVAARHAIEAMSARESVTTWGVDDTGFLKQGTHSVGVQRQYTGSAGKIARRSPAKSFWPTVRMAIHTTFERPFACSVSTTPLVCMLRPRCGASMLRDGGEAKPSAFNSLGIRLGARAFRRTTWREGTGGKLS
jgi:hypothetical protein